ncbi:hypothetical protein [Dyadobacter frigoris]|uniref:Uncharacterized protein n=1 Tax=Dyadobacter frigoris TaxID=2576211 RepID=A0A4U6D8S2_9BACT|nr:hypothetical protein [Dyadobacter frigoris]TKT92508.1 hypothetical protein FDK13_11145 [Dyadobacter frigoris]GLU55301.1 hypothetical protein Dfri01_47620 [Dyadobacter frigoris]
MKINRISLFGEKAWRKVTFVFYSEGLFPVLFWIIKDVVTGENLGKALKNGTYLYHVKSGTSDSLTVSVLMNGICEVKDKNGKTVLPVHKNYK